MRKNALQNLLAAFIIILSSCSEADRPAAYGHFEAREWIVSAAGSGKILWLDIEEGDALTKGQPVGQIDTAELSLQKIHLDNQIVNLRASLPDVGLQIGTLKEKKNVAEKEYLRVDRLVQSGAADRKKLDQIEDELALVDRQIAAALSSLHRETAAILAQIEALEMQRDITTHRIQECAIVNPEKGRVALQFAKRHGFTASGHPLYKLIDTGEMTLHSWFGRAASTTLNRGEVKVAIDHPYGK